MNRPFTPKKGLGLKFMRSSIINPMVEENTDELKVYQNLCDDIEDERRTINCER